MKIYENFVYFFALSMVSVACGQKDSSFKVNDSALEQWCRTNNKFLVKLRFDFDLCRGVRPENCKSNGLEDNLDVVRQRFCSTFRDYQGAGIIFKPEPVNQIRVRRDASSGRRRGGGGGGGRRPGRGGGGGGRSFGGGRRFGEGGGGGGRRFGEGGGGGGRRFGEGGGGGRSFGSNRGHGRGGGGGGGGRRFGEVGGGSGRRFGEGGGGGRSFGGSRRPGHGGGRGFGNGHGGPRHGGNRSSGRGGPRSFGGGGRSFGGNNGRSFGRGGGRGGGSHIDRNRGNWRGPGGPSRGGNHWSRPSGEGRSDRGWRGSEREEGRERWSESIRERHGVGWQGPERERGGERWRGPNRGERGNGWRGPDKETGRPGWRGPNSGRRGDGRRGMNREDGENPVSNRRVEGRGKNWEIVNPQPEPEPHQGSRPSEITVNGQGRRGSAAGKPSQESIRSGGSSQRGKNGGRGPHSSGRGRGGGHRRRAAKLSNDRLKKLKDKCSRHAARQMQQADQMRQMRRGRNLSQRPVHRGWKNRNAKARRQKTELSINNPDDYWNGDTLLTEEQADIIDRDLTSAAAGRKKRKVGQTAYVLWNNFPISYDFSSSVTGPTQTKIRQAIQLWEDNTCVRFQENGPSTNRLEFTNGGGCSSYVGMVGGTQEVSIYTPGCDQLGIIAHEIGHALGFHHEQARSDRDNYISVNMANINFWYQNNFAKVGSHQMNDFGHPYDYGSVMHYDAYGFASNPNVPTIQTLDDNHQSTIGQRNGPSFIDFAQVNSAYCRNKCGQSAKCQHNGYPHPNNCQQCICPEGTGGRICDIVQYSTCGGELEAYKQEGYITSPNYPSSFPSNSHCAWLIKTDSNHKVYVEFVETFGLDCKDVCDDTYVEIKFGDSGNDFRKTGGRFCCDRPATKLESTNNEMVIIFRSQGHSGRGFKAKYWTDAATNRGPGPVTAKPQTRPPVTRRPITRPPPRPRPGGGGASGGNEGGPGCNCQPWGRWSACSQHCGGCGKIERSRWCAQDDCFNHEARKCNLNACPSGQNVLFANGQFHVVINGCCLGLFQDDNGVCGGLANGGLTRAIPSLVRTIVNGFGGGGGGGRFGW